MIEIQGAYNTARCYTDALDEKAAEQIRAVCDREEFAGCRIRIMPDVHAGKGCTIGTTMTLHGRVVPGMVGVDIGCGMETVRLSASFLEPEKLDAVIRQEVPAGFDIRAVPHPLAGEIDLSRLHCASRVNLNRAVRSIGTLGGGNHFIEAGKGDGGGIYLIVHTGSRHLGCEVANHYQRAAEDALRGCSKEQLRALREELKAEGRQQEIPKAVQERKSAEIPLPRELSYVEGSLYEEYLHDMKLVQQYAALNRRAIVQAILSGMSLEAEEQFSTIHNYIDTESGILRKGAVSARAGERLLIPMNMRDGSLICIGRGNPEWNFSAPHGAGRLMSRSEAFGTLSMEEYRESMAGIYSTCVLPETLDEAPMAYRPMEEILSQIGETVSVEERIRPFYNFKAAEKPSFRKC